VAISKEKTIKELLEDDTFELPVGFTDSTGTFQKTVKIRELTGAIEEALAEPKIRQNGGKVITEAVYSLVEQAGNMKKFTKMDARNLTTADRDFILLMNHKVSLGDEIEYQAQCTHCGEIADTTVNIDDIPVTYATEDEPKQIPVTLPRGIKGKDGEVFKELKISYPTGLVQERILPTLSKNHIQAVTQMISMCVESIKGLEHYNFDTFREMGKKDRNAVQDALNKLKVGADLAPEVECPNCGKDFKAPITTATLLGE